MDSKGKLAAGIRDEIVWDDEAPVPPTAPAAGHRSGRRRRQTSRGQSHVIVGALTIGAGVGGGLAGCHPTGTSGLDVAYTALFAVMVTVAASRASRANIVILAALAAGVSRGWLLLPAGAALAMAFGAVFPRRSYQRLNALIGAVAIQVVLRWPPVGFHGLTALLAAVAVIPVLLSARSRQRRRWRTITTVGAGAIVLLAGVFTLPLALGALFARTPVTNGIASTRQALTAISAGDASSAAAKLHAATTELSIAHSRTGSWWTLGGALVPVVAEQRRALANATDAARTLTEAAAREATAVDFRDLNYHQGQIDVAAIQAMTAPLTALDGQIAAAQRQLVTSRSEWLVAPIAAPLGTFSQELNRARGSADLGAQVARAAPPLLGGSGVRHYFVAFMTPAETRGLDGFIGAYGELTVDHGRVTLTRSGSITDLNLALRSRVAELSGLAQYLARYGAFDPAGHFQDVTYSPDFPTVAKVISQMYPQVGGDRIDGVLALDPDALSALLRFTGPINVAGLPTPLTAANAANVLLRQQYLSFPASGQQAGRHDFLQNALQAAFGRIFAGSLPNPRTLSADLATVVQQGRLLFWSDHPADQPILQRLGVAGAFPQPGQRSDLLAVTISNAGNNKIDAYLHENITDRVEYNPATGHIEAAVTLVLHNSAPASGLPDYVIKDNAGTGLASGTNEMWLSVYTPLQFGTATTNGGIIGFSPGTPELGVNAYSAFVEVPAASTTTVTLNLDGNVTPGSSYQLALRLQPLAYTPSASVSVQPSAGWVQGGPALWQATSTQVQTHAWRFTHS